MKGIGGKPVHHATTSTYMQGLAARVLKPDNPHLLRDVAKLIDEYRWLLNHYDELEVRLGTAEGRLDALERRWGHS